jgi:hypothetical protein
MTCRPPSSRHHCGEHSAELLADLLGLKAAAVAGLRKDGIV